MITVVHPCSSRICSAVSWGSSVEFPLTPAEEGAAIVVFSVDDSAIIVSSNSPAELVRRSSNDVLCLFNVLLFQRGVIHPIWLI